jgi:hypothetical protein
VCQEFGLVNSTIQTIWKNRIKTISAFEQNGSKIKRLQKPEVRHKNGKLDPEQEEDKEKEEEEKVEVPTPSVSEALEAIRVVNCFYEARAGNSKIVSQIMGIEGHLENQY